MLACSRCEASVTSHIRFLGTVVRANYSICNGCLAFGDDLILSRFRILEVASGLPSKIHSFAMNEPARLSHIDERLFPSLKPLSGNALVGVLIQRKRSTTNELTTRRVSPRFQMKIGEVIHHYEDSDLLIVQYRDGSREVSLMHPTTSPMLRLLCLLIASTGFSTNLEHARGWLCLSLLSPRYQVLTEHEVKEFALPGNAYVMMGYDKPSLRTKRGSSSSTEASGKPSDESPSKAV